MASPGLQIGQLSHRTGCNIETIRYYERIGLLPKPLRRGRYRQYEAADVARLGFVRRARELGFTLDEVRTLLDLAVGGPETCARARELADQHLAQVRGRIADLRRMERVLADTVRACGERDHTGCPLIDTLALAATANTRAAAKTRAMGADKSALDQGRGSPAGQLGPPAPGGARSTRSVAKPCPSGCGPPS